jgi:hypothetical protein
MSGAALRILTSAAMAPSAPDCRSFFATTSASAQPLRQSRQGAGGVRPQRRCLQAAVSGRARGDRRRFRTVSDDGRRHLSRAESLHISRLRRSGRLPRIRPQDRRPRRGMHRAGSSSPPANTGWHVRPRLGIGSGRPAARSKLASGRGRRRRAVRPSHRAPDPEAGEWQSTGRWSEVGGPLTGLIMRYAGWLEEEGG